MMHRFVLERRIDVSGISGVGDVAEGVVFNDGTTVLRWLAIPGVRSTTVIHDDIASVVNLHGHGGHSHVRWIDEEPG